MKLGFIFHLYQPALQKESIFRKVYVECYSPLVKFLKSHRDFNLTINVPLSLLELMETFGYSDWIDDVKALVDSSRIELIGSAAYHPLLTHLPTNLVDEQIILNEMGLGYYLGSRQDFEGSPASMIKDVSGFFPPELAINDSLLSSVSELGYSWVVSNNVSLCDGGVCPSKSAIYRVGDYSAAVLIRDHHLSNLLAFKRDLDVTDIVSYISSLADDSCCFAVLDGETFGHHFRNGITLLEIMYAKLRADGVEVLKVSDIMRDCDATNVNKIHESTWGSVSCNECGSTGYPLWLNENNKAQVLLKKMQDLVISSLSTPNVSVETVDTPWKSADELMLAYINIHKFLCSDKFWWLSGVTLPSGDHLYQKDLVLSYLDMLEKNAKTSLDISSLDTLTSLVSDLRSQI